jgi:hypothetical protein
MEEAMHLSDPNIESWRMFKFNTSMSRAETVPAKLVVLPDQPLNTLFVSLGHP